MDKVNPDCVIYDPSNKFSTIYIKGDRGDNGEKGDRGFTGVKGAKGDNNGIMGPKGDRGEIGNKGPKGPVGNKGMIGNKGNKGEQGLCGISGQRGFKGEIGQKGQKGECGQKGKCGDNIKIKDQIELSYDSILQIRNSCANLNNINLYLVKKDNRANLNEPKSLSGSMDNHIISYDGYFFNDCGHLFSGVQGTKGEKGEVSNNINGIYVSEATNYELTSLKSIFFDEKICKVTFHFETNLGERYITLNNQPSIL